MFEIFCIYKVEHPLTYLFNYGRPSMEMDAHLHLNKATIHTHPIELLTILCSVEVQSIINELYFNFNYSYFDYVTPGFDTGIILSNHLNSSQKEVIFIQNHGIFVSSLNFEKSYDLTKKINHLAKKYLLSRKKQIKDKRQTDGILFPDAAVNKKNNKSINDIIYNKIIECGLTPNFLSLEQIEKLINLEQEKYRINMVLNEDNIR
jgi:rhamnose utilization protein RhaD (predicted bifunctional aldolase and dehydrogenase)